MPKILTLFNISNQALEKEKRVVGGGKEERWGLFHKSRRVHFFYNSPDAGGGAARYFTNQEPHPVVSIPLFNGRSRKRLSGRKNKRIATGILEARHPQISYGPQTVGSERDLTSFSAAHLHGLEMELREKRHDGDR